MIDLFIIFGFINAAFNVGALARPPTSLEGCLTHHLSSHSKYSDHALLRLSEGKTNYFRVSRRPTAKISDVFIQWDGRIIIRGLGGREHIFEPDGTLVTTVNHRSNEAHKNKIYEGERYPVTVDEFSEIEKLFGNHRTY